MARRIALVLLVLLSILSLTVPAAARTRESGPVILCYHIVESPMNSSHAITRAAFVRQMSFLAESGYRVISLEQLSDELASGNLPANTVVVTVDDGWKSTLTEVLPVMQKFGFPFTAFIYPRFIAPSPLSLSWDDVRTLVRAGVDVQSHTYSHAFLTRKRQRSRSGAEYAKWLHHELVDSRRTIERQIGKPVRFLAYPYGDYDSNVARAVAAAGYDAALTCNEGPITARADAYKLRRFAIDRSTTLEQFKSYIRESGRGEPRRPEAPNIQLAKKPASPKPTPKKRVVVAATMLPLAHVALPQSSSRPVRPTRKPGDSTAKSVAIVNSKRDFETLEEESDEG